jgi:hypothetical protein
MKIEPITWAWFLGKLSEVKIRGTGQQAYTHSTPTVLWSGGGDRMRVRSISGERSLLPTQNYLLRRQLVQVEWRRYDSDAFIRDGYAGAMIDGVPFLPPILEPHGENFLVADGMPRIYELHSRSSPLSAQTLPAVIAYPTAPYYALPTADSWENPKILDEIPEGFVKKTYRDPDNYKALFRDYADVFGPENQVKR